MKLASVLSRVRGRIRAARSETETSTAGGTETEQQTSGRFWEQIYASGRTSGTGSYGRLAEFKAEVLNDFVRTHDIQSVIELGCGDGNQLSLAEYPSYVGYDVAPTAVAACEARFRTDATKRFRLYEPGMPVTERAELAISLDVIYHLLEDAAYEDYMQTLFSVADRYVIVYSSDYEEPETTWWEVRHRKFTDWVTRNAPQWTLVETIPNRYPYVAGDGTTSWSDFFVFTRGRT